MFAFFAIHGLFIWSTLNNKQSWFVVQHKFIDNNILHVNHDFSNDGVSTIKHGIITNYNIYIYLYPYLILFWPQLPAHQTNPPKKPSNKNIWKKLSWETSGSPSFHVKVHQRFWLVWFVELASELFLGAVWHFFIWVVPWILHFLP